MHGSGSDHSHIGRGRPPARGGACARVENAKRLAVTLALAGGYMVAEVIGGLVANSLAAIT